MRDIANHDLMVNGKAADFAVKEMHEIVDNQVSGTENPHRHNFYLVLWATSAKGEHEIDLQTFPIEPNSVFFLHPEQVHQIRAEKDAEGIVILFGEDFLIRNGFHDKFISGLNLFHENGHTGFLQLEEPPEELSHIAGQMQKVFQSSGPYREEKFASYLRLFLVMCSEIKMKTEPVPVTDPVPETVRKFKQLVEQNYQEWHKVSDYAEKLLISPNYLNEVIKKNTGRSAKEHIRNRLVAEAKRLSHFTGLSSKEIGFRLGFNDPSHFAKFLKKFVSPGNT